MDLDILAITDEVDQRIYSASVAQRMSNVQMVIGCGDLPANYLEFLSDALNKPVYYVLGNHAEELTRAGDRGIPRHPEGCIDLGGKVITDPGTGLIMAGLPGSLRYSMDEPVQYTEWQMTWMIWKMTPRLLWNRYRHGRALDLLVSHAPPRDVNDREDPAHRGFVAMRRFLRRFHPAYQLHGHIHLYDRSKPNTARFDETEVINVYPYQNLTLSFAALDDPHGTTTERSSHQTRSSGELEVEHRA
ncbi:MAG TPA: metallophosphoesterase [Thermomicrobiales bacterium]|nr:metallophosphoesterase [Thermomicrobiales bacterium]